MSKRKNPASMVVEFFQEAPEEKALLVFQISKGIVERRGLLAGKKKPAKAATRPKPTPTPASTDEAARNLVEAGR